MIGFSRFRSSALISAIGVALMAFSHQVVDTVKDLAYKVASAILEPVSMARTEAELAQNAAVTLPTNNGRVLVGKGSGGSPLSFVSLLKDLNSRAFSAAC